MGKSKKKFNINKFPLENIMQNITVYLDEVSLIKLSYANKKINNLVKPPKCQNYFEKFEENKKILTIKKKNWEEIRSKYTEEKIDSLDEKLEDIFNDLTSEENLLEKSNQIIELIEDGASCENVSISLYKRLIEKESILTKDIFNQIYLIGYHLINSDITISHEYADENLQFFLVKSLSQDLYNSYFLDLPFDQCKLFTLKLCELHFKLFELTLMLNPEDYDNRMFNYFITFLKFGKNPAINKYKLKIVQIIFSLNNKEEFKENYDIFIQKSDRFGIILKTYGTEWYKTFIEIMNEYYINNREFIENILRNDDKFLSKFFKSSLLYNIILKNNLQEIYFVILEKKKFRIFYDIIKKQEKYPELFSAPLGKIRRINDNTSLLRNSINLIGCVHKIISELYDEYLKNNSADSKELKEIVNLGIKHKNEKVRDIFEDFV